MITILAKLAETAAQIGSVSEAALYSAGLITIDGTTAEGKSYCLTFHLKEDGEGSNGNP